MVNIKFIGLPLVVGLFGGLACSAFDPNIITRDDTSTNINCNPEGTLEEQKICGDGYFVGKSSYKLYECDRIVGCEDETELGIFMSVDENSYIICTTINGISITCESKSIGESCSTGVVIKDEDETFKLCLDNTSNNAIEIFDIFDDANEYFDDNSHNGFGNNSDSITPPEELYLIPAVIFNKSLSNNKYYIIERTIMTVMPLSDLSGKGKYLYTKTGSLKVLSSANECPEPENLNNGLVEYKIDEGVNAITYTSE